MWRRFPNLRVEVLGVRVKFRWQNEGEQDYARGHWRQWSGKGALYSVTFPADSLTVEVGEDSQIGKSAAHGFGEKDVSCEPFRN